MKLCPRETLRSYKVREMKICTFTVYLKEKCAYPASGRNCMYMVHTGNDLKLIEHLGEEH
jgi:hypothetical protein